MFPSDHFIVDITIKPYSLVKSNRGMPIVKAFHRKPALPVQRPCTYHAAKSKRQDTPTMPNGNYAARNRTRTFSSTLSSPLVL